MAKAVIARLQDMIEAIGQLERATKGKTSDDYQRNWLLQRAAERAIEIISEASRHIPADIKQHHPYGATSPGSATCSATYTIGWMTKSSGPSSETSYLD